MAPLWFWIAMTLVMLAVSLLPLLASRWKAYRILTMRCGVPVALSWGAVVILSVIDYGQQAAFVAYSALTLSFGWLVGLGGGALRFGLRQWDWSLAKYHFVELCVVAVVLFVIWDRFLSRVN